MRRQKMRVLTGVILVVLALIWAGGESARAAAASMSDVASNIAVTIGKAVAAVQQKTVQAEKKNTIQQKKQLSVDRQVAAKKLKGTNFGVTALGAPAVMAPVGSQPDYFGMPNWANSPLPAIAIPTTVTISDTTTPGGSGATAVATVVGGVVAAVTVTNPGAGYLTPSVSIGGTGTGAMATAVVDTTGTTTGVIGAILSIAVAPGGTGYDAVTGGTGLQKFVDQLPGLCDPDRVRNAAPACSSDPTVKAIPLAVPDKTTFPGSDYYEIGLLQTREKMHRDLPPTLLREYVQLSTGGFAGLAVPLANANFNPASAASPIVGYTGVTPPHYLGPLIIATKDIPVRIVFRNLVPGGAAGNLFLPVDTTFMGAGKGPDLAWGETDPLNPYCNQTTKPTGCFTDTRATLHLHGGLNPWISDGTPHQWVTSKDDPTTGQYAKGLSARNVPDMWFDATGKVMPACAGLKPAPGNPTPCAGGTNDPGKGNLTFFYTNQQSARLLFYHDHAFGITRLNVYAGEAAGYLITDPAEQNLMKAGGALAGLGYGIPLVIQDRTFVPDDGLPGGQLANTDPLWDVDRWGKKGSLWLPHVYMPIQNPGGTDPNPYGRWFYGPWFWPPANPLYGPVANNYYDPNCVPSATQWCQPQTVPGTPYLSTGMEAFHDTPVVNGTAYPTLTLPSAGLYRFRILNAANDRFFNLQWYVADTTGTEVALNLNQVAAALADPAGVTPQVDRSKSQAGPAWIQIGTEGGFLPAPVVVPNQEITFVTDPGRFDVGNVDKHALLLGSAERADVVVDFTPFAGKTLILYNDAPAAFPARDPRYDYYAGNADQRGVGGAPSTVTGYGPNTRTIMKIVVPGTAGASAPDYVNTTTLAALQTALKSKSAGGQGIFETYQHPIIVGQGAYNSAYGTNFLSQLSWCNDPASKTALCDGFVRIFEQGGDLFGFNSLANALQVNAGTASWARTEIPLQPKGMHDEPNAAAFDEYGRMTANLGLEAPGATPLLQNIILYPYVNPPTEMIDGTNLPQGSDIQVTPIASGGDGTQIWKITHNGVDTHPIHFHLYDVQLLNRSPWDGQIILPPDPNELGWKDTVRISPLEDTYVALRAVVPKPPFDVPNSIRYLNPMLPPGSDVGFNSVDPNGNPTAAITNVPINFGWEYVWHCHILSHEEMDMMRPQSLVLPPNAPVVGYSLSGNKLTMTWSDNSLNETAWVVQIDTGTGFQDLETITSLTPDTYGPTALSRAYGVPKGTYTYRVVAQNTVGYGNGFPALTAQAASNTYSNAGSIPLGPTALVATAQAGPQVRLTFKDNANNETGFAVQRCTGTGCTNFVQIAVAPAAASTGTTVTFTDTSVTAPLTGSTTYVYQVYAVNAMGMSTTFAGPASAIVQAPPVAPAAPLTAAAVNASNQGQTRRVTVSWTVGSTANLTGFTVQAATDSAFTAIVSSTPATAAARSVTVGNLGKATYYYFRVRADNVQPTGSSSSAWLNAAPFPILTNK